MLKELILQHKKEKEDYLLGSYIRREKLAVAEKFIDTQIIKVISGPRRAGKSIFLFLLLKNKDFAYINFDDENILKIKNLDELLKAIIEVYGDTKNIFFDEIQNLKDWEIFVNKLNRRGYNLFITGSNAKLLSKELSTHLTGRYIPIEVFPFSFKEFLVAKNFDLTQIELPEVKGKLLNHLDNYLKIGGFPEVVVKNLEAKTYLDTLSDSILLKDVVKRYKVRFAQKLYELFIYLASNFSRPFSFNSLRNNLNFNSTKTVQDYLNYLEESFLVFLLNRFSFKIKEQIKTPKKIYFVDNGFIFAKAFRVSPDLGRLMENVVFSELLKKGFKPNQNIFYYYTHTQKEIDFLLKKGTAVEELIQVVYQINPQTKKREIKALLEASYELKCENLTIISWEVEEKENIKNKQIKIIPLWKWLLEKDFIN